MFICLECGRKFRTANAAYKASLNGCPKCGGVDIDIDLEEGRHDTVSRDAAKEPRFHSPSRSADSQE
jgi:predicted  nucleic acid-binding Zn-ribbon protein